MRGRIQHSTVECSGGTRCRGRMCSRRSIGASMNSLCASSAELLIQFHHVVTWNPVGARAWDTWRTHCWNLRARVAGSPGSSFGRSETKVCIVFRIMLSSPVLGPAAGAGDPTVPEGSNCSPPAAAGKDPLWDPAPQPNVGREGAAPAEALVPPRPDGPPPGGARSGREPARKEKMSLLSDW